MSSDSTQQDLQRAYELIKAGKKAEAEALLLPILKADESNANAWWLLSNAVSGPGETREALEQVLRLRPGDAKAQKMLDDLNRRHPADEFPMQEEFGDLGAAGSSIWGSELAEKPKRGRGELAVRKSSSGGSNPLLIVLAVVGVLALIGCGLCFILPTLGISLFGQQIAETILTAIPEDFMLTITAMPGGSFTQTGNLNLRGGIEYGQTVQGTIRGTDDDGWSFSGTAGDRVIIEVNATDDDLDPHVFLLDPSDKQIGYNDDIDFGTNRNSRIEVTLPATGTYTIRVGEIFDGSGSYELILRRGG